MSRAQTQQAAPPAQSTADTNADNSEEPDAPVTHSATSDKGDVESGTNTAWEMLRTALSDSKAQARQARIDAVTALGAHAEVAEKAATYDVHVGPVDGSECAGRGDGKLGS